LKNQPSDQFSQGYAMAQPAMLDYALPMANDAALKLLVKGFNDIPMERRLLNGTVMLSQRRLPRLELLSDADSKSADAVLIDARDPQAMKWAADQPWLMHKAVIWVDAQTVRHGHTLVRRPVQWPNLPIMLARALEQSPQKLTDAQHAGEMPDKTAAVAPVAAQVQLSVLVIDDSLAVRAYLRSLLESRGFAVTAVDCAEAGIAAAAAAPYACILMDVLMPGINGYEACRTIKSRSRTGSAPAIVMLTSKSSPFDHIRGKMLLRYAAVPVHKTIPHPQFTSTRRSV
jgi:two-component system, cell cycle response regulator